MKSLLLSLLALVFTTQVLSAQKISGVVVLSDGKTAEFATAVLHAASDSSVVKGALCGADGTFEFTGIEPGRYTVSANLLGSGSATVPAFDYAGGELDLKQLSLRESATNLSEVTIVARKPTIEMKADKTVLNVEGTINSTGLNALELLRKAPGVTVDNNENLQVRGKNSVRVMIDGREVPLDGKDLAAQLKGLQASDIANIEIISNPSAKYDASGNAGIINIRLKKNKALGTNGNVGVEGIYGKTMKGGMNLSLNHRAKHFNAFGSYNNHFGDWANENNFYREQSGLTFTQKAIQANQSRWNSARVGLDYFLNDRHTIGVLANGSYDPGDWGGTSLARIGRTEAPGAVDSLLDASNDIDGERRDLNLNFNYRFADTSGRSFNVDVDRGVYRLRGESYQPNYYLSPDGQTILNTRIYQNSTPTDIDIVTVKSDYEQNLFGGVFGVGFKVADVQTDNTFDFFNIVENVPVKDLNVSNRFVYKERTSAGYVNYQHKFGKMHVQAGLRVENTDYTGELIAATPQNGETVENEYTELFPSAALTYSFTEKLGLNMTYSRRIDRPSYQDLNPFENKLDELTFQKGNPMLRPQFTNSFELSPTYQGMPVLTIGYSHTKDVFTQVLDTAGARAAFITQENIADQKNYTLTLNAPTPIAKWWDGFVSFTGFRSHFEASFREDFSFDQSFTAFNLYGEQNFKLPKGFSIQLSGWYNSRAFWGTLRSNPQGAMDLGIQKKLFDGKGEMRLRLGDILHTANWSGENIFTPGLRMTAAGNWESRTVTLNFSYRFGSAEVKGARQRRTGLEDEGRRVKGRG